MFSLNFKKKRKKGIVLWFLGSLTCITSGGMIACIILLTQEKRSPNEPQPPPPVRFKIDGTNWVGHIQGELNYEITGDKVWYAETTGYMAHDWIIPNFVYDDAGHEYQVERILEQAFMQENATFTGELVIADTISNIGKNAFLKAFTDGTRLVIGNNVEWIQYGAFKSCGFVGDINLPNSLLTIGDLAFAYMNKINGAISIGSQVTSIGEDAFYDNTAKEIHLLSAWNYAPFQSWYKSGTPTDNLVLGGRSWASGRVFVDGNLIYW